MISSAVNLASRLEGLAKEYGVQIIASGPIIFGLEDPTRYSYRIIGKIAVRGMSESTSVHEVFESDQDEQKERKTKTRDTFEKAVYILLDIM